MVFGGWVYFELMVPTNWQFVMTAYLPIEVTLLKVMATCPRFCPSTVCYLWLCKSIGFGACRSTHAIVITSFTKGTRLWKLGVRPWLNQGLGQDPIFHDWIDEHVWNSGKDTNWVVVTQIFFYVHPGSLGKWSNFDSYFSDGLVQPPTSQSKGPTWITSNLDTCKCSKRWTFVNEGPRKKELQWKMFFYFPIYTGYAPNHPT